MRKARHRVGVVLTQAEVRAIEAALVASGGPPALLDRVRAWRYGDTAADHPPAALTDAQRAVVVWALGVAVCEFEAVPGDGDRVAAARELAGLLEAAGE